MQSIMPTNNSNNDQPSQVRITLNAPADWDDWYAQIKGYSMINYMWKYMDPALDDEPETPAPPVLPAVSNTPANKDEMDLAKYQLSVYSASQQNYSNYSTGFQRVYLEIKATSGKHARTLIADQQSLWSIMKALQDYFAPDKLHRVSLFSNKLAALQKGPGNRSMEAWGTDWVMLHQALKKHKIMEAERMPAYFIKAVEAISESYGNSIYTQWSEDMDKFTLPKLCSNFIHWSRNHTIKNNRAVFTTFQDQDSNQQQTGQQSNSNQASSSSPNGKSNNSGSINNSNFGKTSKFQKKPCSDLTGKPSDKCCASRGECTVINPKHRPENRSKQWKQYFNTYISKLREMSNPYSLPRRFHDTEVIALLDSAKSNSVVAATTIANDEDSPAECTMACIAGSSSAATGPSATVLSTQSAMDMSNSWALDTCADVHVVNHQCKASFTATSVPSNNHVKVGNTAVNIVAYGTCELWATTIEGKPFKFTLSNVAYVPGFHLNLISESKLKKAGFWFHGLEDKVYSAKGKPILQLHRPDGSLPFFKVTTTASEPLVYYWPTSGPSDLPVSTQQAMAASKPTVMATCLAVQSSREPLHPRKLSGLNWHYVFGHINQEKVMQLPNLVIGAELITKGPNAQPAPRTHSCTTCALCKSKRTPSRRERTQVNTPFGMLSLDCVPFTVGYNRHEYMLHSYDLETHIHFVKTSSSKDEEAWLGFIKDLVAFVQSMNRELKILASDNDPSLGLQCRTYFRNQGILWQPAAPYTQAQNPAETGGRLIIIMARCLHLQSRLPKSLWPETVAAASYILNRTPILHSGTWTTPFYLATGVKPSVAHLRVYGCKAYLHLVGTQEPAKLDKLAPRAHIGYLVGWDSTAIFRIWVPSKNKVIRTRDVIFNEQEFYEPSNADIGLISDDDIFDWVPTEPAQQPEQFLELQEALQPDPSNPPPYRPIGETLLDNTAAIDSNIVIADPAVTPVQPLEPQPEPEPSSPKVTIRKLDYVSVPMLEDSALQPDPEPKTTVRHLESVTIPVPKAADIAGIPLFDDNDIEQDTPMSGGETQSDIQQSLEDQAMEDTEPHSGFETLYQDQQSNQSTNFYLNQLGKRQRTYATQVFFCTVMAAVLTAKLALSSQASFSKNPSLHKPAPRTLHRDSLPLEPKHWKHLNKSLYKQQWLAASEVEFSKFFETGTFEWVDKPPNLDTEPLPLMWVHRYKFDSEGFLETFKSRLCARGDLQATELDTYAATLAAKCFRAAISIGATFDLELDQMDAIAAYLNADLPYALYLQPPDGFSNGNKILRCHKAIYGLKEAGMLWQSNLGNTLETLGFSQIPGAECLYTNGHIIIYFYIDDTIAMYHIKYKAEYLDFKQKLFAIYKFNDLGPLQWFLGIKVIRDRPNRTIWLSQQSYVEKMASTYSITNPGKVNTPLSPYLDFSDPQYSEPGTPDQIKAYQRRVGSINYAAVQTRPDIAKAASVLSQFLTKANHFHLQQADYCLKYLLNTKDYCLQLGGQGTSALDITGQIYSNPAPPELLGYSDASYGDDSATRKSSEGWIFSLFKGPIDWKATKQKTVTKSTTEAELLALSHAGSELLWWQRFFDNIGLTFDKTPTLQCDNKQTLGIVTKEAKKLQTSLRHVDIHQHWLRQEYQQGTLAVQWIPTSEMVADGLTKLLPPQKHQEFCKLLNLHSKTF